MFGILYLMNCHTRYFMSQKYMLIFVISDINQDIHPKMPLQMCIFTVLLVSLGVKIREGD